ncbi:hypothetical protein Psuf_061630 [Phytohabitans suffuscus]|uniref:Uncharacterized protein n=1 Tax=Phytohabitans suffuscus TaxID=624315 RepID=A0A6F8YRS5_9ACTN|nr:hypothetical protein Psuf_061630 [Phytohabitans suffuscus]
MHFCAIGPSRPSVRGSKLEHSNSCRRGSEPSGQLHHCHGGAFRELVWPLLCGEVGPLNKSVQGTLGDSVGLPHEAVVDYISGQIGDLGSPNYATGNILIRQFNWEYATRNPYPRLMVGT